MVILVLIDVHYSYNGVFSFEKSLNYQNTPPQVLTIGKKNPSSKVFNFVPLGGNSPSPTTPYRYLENPGLAHFLS